MNDRDSDALVTQNKRLPDAIRVISGRFERNPPRYYRMRIARVEGEIKTNPRQFGLYDDLAVAHDRVGDDGTAMRVMAQKRALLPAYNAADKENKEAWYRYFANDGTFRAHRFLHEGAKVARIGEMKQARDEIKRAIEIKPNAHFGRERVQLMVMDWIIARKTDKTTKTLGEWMEIRDGWRINFYWGSTAVYTKRMLDHPIKDGTGDSREQIAAKQQHRRDTAEGLAGLIVLGAAWNSPDVFEALARALEVEDTVALRYLALTRCRELLEAQKPSFVSLSVAQVNEALDDSVELSMSGIGINGPNKDTLNSLYRHLRKEADGWNASRAKWMDTKFALGQHPDTDANFWEGWKESAPPTLDVPWLNLQDQRQRARNSNLVSSIVGLGAILLFSVGLSIAIMGFRKRQLAKTFPT